MPIHASFDKQKNKPYFQFGSTGHKYYFTKSNIEDKYNQCLQQARAIKANQAKRNK
jgi:hypothetical protein